MVLNDSIADGQPETGALSGLFGAEKWVEDAVNNSRRNTTAVVLEDQAHLAGISEIASLNADSAPVLDRLEGIHQQVEIDLLHLVDVDIHQRQILGEGQCDGTALPPELGLYHAHHFLDSG